MELFFDLLEVESPNALITQLGVKEFEEWCFLKCRIKGGVFFITLMLGLNRKDFHGKYCSSKACICSYWSMQNIIKVLGYVLLLISCFKKRLFGSNLNWRN